MDQNGGGKKVGIVTIIDYTNFGNRLQNYAVDRVVASLGFEPETIVNFPNASDEPGKIWVRAGDEASRRDLRAGRLRRLRDRLSSEGVWKVVSHSAVKLRRRVMPNRKDKADAELARLKLAKAARGRVFTTAALRESGFTLYRDTPTARLNDAYAFFVVGSDQVWNPHFRKLSEVDFLTFAHPSKRIAFSASMGVSEIAPEHQAFYSTGLAGFARISVREDAAAAVVRELTGREVPVTVDPTLVVEPNVWAALARRHERQPDRSYLLTYFIGERTPAVQQLVDDYATRHGLKVVHLNDPAAPDLYTADPAEFVGFIRDAAVFLTDSFHGAIFSVLMDTPFVALPRMDGNASMSSRMDTLLATLQLAHRNFRPDMDAAARDALLTTDYAHTGPIIAQKRAEALDYLARALDVAPVVAQRATSVA